MYYKEFEKFNWEVEEGQALTMPYFYLGKYLFPIAIQIKILDFILSIYISWPWKWNINHSFYL